jgi:hypothetical protein
MMDEIGISALPSANMAKKKNLIKGLKQMANLANEAFVLEDVELFFTKIDPENPTEISQDGKTGWETQIRTTDKAVAKEWRSLALVVKAVREDKEDEDSKIIYWKTTLRRKEFNAKNTKVIESISDDEGISFEAAKRKALKSGEAASSKAPTVIDGDLEDIDPTTIGNGSIANVRVFQYDYTFKGKDGVASVLMGMQITTLMEYVPQARDGGFSKTTTKRVSVGEQQGNNPSDDYEEEEENNKGKASKKKAAPKKPVELDDEIPF